MRIGIVGGGVSGLAAARAAADRGAEVVVFDKGRGFGGRLSTRRVELDSGDVVSFDHGCPSFFAALGRDGERFPFRETVERAVGDGAARWVEPEEAAGTPGMNAFVAWLGTGLDVRFGERVTRLEIRGEGAALHGEAEVLGEFDRVIVTAPAPQALALVEGLDGAGFERLREIEYEPRWVGLLCASEAIEARELRGDGSVLESLTSHDGRAWVARATASWSLKHVERDAGEVCETLAGAARGAHGAFDDVAYRSAHRWRYARVSRWVSAWNVSGAGGRVLVCGDGFRGNAVFSAWASGAVTGRDAAR